VVKVARAIATHKAEAYKNIKNAAYSDKYVEIHLTNLNELALLNRLVSETKKVADFLERISAPSLMTAKENVLGDNDKLQDFLHCQQYRTQVRLSLKEQKVTTTSSAAVATTSCWSNNNSNGGQKKKIQKVSSVLTKHYTANEWSRPSTGKKA
jgi:hypothetical protein